MIYKFVDNNSKQLITKRIAYKHNSKIFLKSL
jgi:hypothetical protein